jgi:hypothetical protein
MEVKMTVVKLKPKPKSARLQCSSCGAEGTGSCDCGVGYMPAEEFAAVFAAANPGLSVRTLAEKTGVSKSAAHRAKQVSHDGTPSIGKDGKLYSAKRQGPTFRLIPDDDEMPSQEEEETGDKSNLPFGGDIVKRAMRRLVEFIGAYEQEMTAKQRREFRAAVVERYSK